MELPIGVAGHLLAWEKDEADGTWGSWVQETGGRRPRKVVQVRAASVRPLEPPEASRRVLRRVRPRRADPRWELTGG